MVASPEAIELGAPPECAVVIPTLKAGLDTSLWKRLSEPLLLLASDSEPDGKIWVALSGGADSSLLLWVAVEVMRELNRSQQLACVHVDHGVHPESGVWARSCQRLAQSLGVSFHTAAIEARMPDGVSVEAWLREQRYQLLAECLGPADHLLTAHHQDDQAETFLLQALRGSGVRGLSGLARCIKLGKGLLVRPWIDVPRADIRWVVQQLGMEVINDPSNESLRFDRNYLRKAVMPDLSSRWPQWASCLARAAHWQSEAQALLDDYAADLYRSVHVEGATHERVSVSGLKSLRPRQRRLLLRYWLRHLGLPVGDHRHIAEVEKLVASAADAQGKVCWAGVQVRRHADWLYASAFSNREAVQSLEGTREWYWDISESCDLGSGLLRAEPMLGRGVRASLLASGVVVRLRTGGERIRPVGDRHTRSVKHLLQARGIPPWERADLPMIYVDGRLVAVADLWTAAGTEADPNEPGWIFHWTAAGRSHDQQ